MNRVLRDAGLSSLLTESPLETLAEGFEFTEGPLWLPDDSLLFQDIKAERTYRVRSSESAQVQILRDRNGAANGQTFGPDGLIYFCEQNGRRVSRMRADGSGVEPVVETWEGKRLNSPNDIVARPDGVLYFTDPPYGVKPENKEIPFQGVFALTTNGDLRLVVADGFEKPNGLAFAPDGKTFYVCDTAKYHVRAFSLDAAGVVEPGSDRVFCTMDPGEPGGPDGLKVDLEGRVYVAVALGIWVYEPDGSLLGILATPKRPSNLNWWGREGQALAITAVDAVHRVELNVKGLTPPFLPVS